MTNIDLLLDEMSLEEQVSLLSGEDFWSLPAIEKLDIHKLRVTDGPNGARGVDFLGGVKAAAFPVGISIGATWSPELAYEIGAAVAHEVKLKSAHVLLAPTVNIHRSVTNGRNFECYSEDPELTADLAVGYIQGLQDNGISATIKHFVGNESEIERTTISSEIDERSLREIYLRPFEDAVKIAGTWGIMSSYNKLNGTYTAENHWLLTEVLREEWGYDGIVMSDWFGSRSTAPTINAGLNLEMPGPTRDRGDKLIDAVKTGDVDRAQIRKLTKDILTLLVRTNAISDIREFSEQEGETDTTRALIRRAGAEGSVLLKNEGVLPLSAPKGKVAVIGPNGKTAQIMGGGSANLNPYRRVSPYDGLVARLGANRVDFAKGCDSYRWLPLIENEVSVVFYDNLELAGEPVYTSTDPSSISTWMGNIAEGRVAPDEFSVRQTTIYSATDSGIHHLGLHATGGARAFIDGELVVDFWNSYKKGRTFFEEGCDEVVGEVALEAGKTYEIVVEFKSRKGDNLGFHAVRFGMAKPLGDHDIAEAARVAARAEQVILCIGRSGEWDTEGSDLEDITLPGRQDELAQAVLAANPDAIILLQTGGPVEMPWVDEAKAILQAWYPGQEAGHAIADMLYGDVEPSGRLPQSFPKSWRDNPTHSQDPLTYPGLGGKVRYDEGLFIGYRHYDQQNIAPLFAFGHGLGYTKFTMGDVSASSHNEGVKVSVPVANTGARRGQTVVQIYVRDIESSVTSPVKELKGFKKLALDAGENRNVDITLSHRDFAYFDTDAGLWQVEAGRFEILAGFSAADIRSRVEIEREQMSLPK